MPVTSHLAPRPARWILAYAGAGRGHGFAVYTVDDFARLITGVDSSGRPQFWLSSGVIVLQLYAPSGRVFEPALGGEPAHGTDWTAYLDSLFADGGILRRLDSAVALATAALGPPHAPFQVSVMIPYLEARDTRFDFLGHSYEVGTAAGRQSATLAYVSEVERRFHVAAFPHLVLDGFYWLHELVPAADGAVVSAVARAVHERHLRLLWIPYYEAENWDRWRALGFDDAWLQPNYFFDRTIPATRLDSAVARAERVQMGIEVEFDWRLLDDPRFADRLGPYLAALALHPELRARSLAVYDGAGVLAKLSRAHAPPALERYRELCATLRR